MSQAILAHFPEGTRITEPGGGFVLWVQLPGKLDSVLLYQEALKAFIAIAPGYLFSPAHKFNDFIRLNAISCINKIQDLSRLGEIATALAEQAAPWRAKPDRSSGRFRPRQRRGERAAVRHSFPPPYTQSGLLLV